LFSSKRILVHFYNYVLGIFQEEVVFRGLEAGPQEMLRFIAQALTYHVQEALD
jgi:hypothetical protein